MAVALSMVSTVNIVALQSLVAVGPLPPSVAPDATSLLDLLVDLQSEVLWESGVYDIVDLSSLAHELAA